MEEIKQYTDYGLIVKAIQENGGQVDKRKLYETDTFHSLIGDMFMENLITFVNDDQNIMKLTKDVKLVNDDDENVF